MLRSQSGGSTETVAQTQAATEAAILVAVRIRPFSAKEEAQLEQPDERQYVPTASNFMHYAEAARSSGKTLRKVVHAIDEHVLVFDPADENDTGGRAVPMGASNKRHKDMRFAFDRVYDETSTQQDVYQGTTKGLLDAVLGGFNATVFAYGATGCGKTFTITGSESDPGVVVLAMQELFERIGKSDNEVEVTVSYLEVYNETIRDLLGDGRALALRDDARQSVTVAGLSAHRPENAQAVMQLLARGNKNRTMSATAANAVSSRSHAVLQVQVRQTPRGGSGLATHVMAATLSIIDLAGSERATVAQGKRVREGANINRSLLALANCINALSDKRQRHVPYRDSKLTRLLKFALAGNSRTAMITCVSPSSVYYEETHNTLKYADRAKRIATHVQRNTQSAAVPLAQYQRRIREQSQEITRLRKALQDQRRRSGDETGAEAMRALRQQTLAAQAVQDARNALARAYAPVREARWEYASSATAAQWYDYCLAGLREWTERAAVLQVTGAPQQAFRRQTDALMRELVRERAVLGRRAQHAAQQIDQYTREAEQQQTPRILAGEQLRQVEQEHRVLSLQAERNALRRHAEMAEQMAAALARQNALLMRLAAECMLGSAAERLPDAYLQAIAGFTEATGAARRAMEDVRAAGGAAAWTFDGSSLVPPSPIVPRTPTSVSRTMPPPQLKLADANNGRRPAPQLRLAENRIKPSERPAKRRRQPAGDVFTRLTRKRRRHSSSDDDDGGGESESAKVGKGAMPAMSPRPPPKEPSDDLDESFASASSSGTNNPRHEPPPPAAQPAKGILKTSKASGAPGPVRFGSARRKSRHAQRPPPGTRAKPATPTKTTPTRPTVTARELTFRSLGGAKKPGASVN